MANTPNTEEIFKRAEAIDANSIVTGIALHRLERVARQWAWELWHADNKRGPFSVDESIVIRGRTVQLKLFISRYGATYQRRWRVDGHAWTAAQVNQTFGF